jgi:hypothetical protein
MPNCREDFCVYFDGNYCERRERELDEESITHGCISFTSGRVWNERLQRIDDEMPKWRPQ